MSKSAADGRLGTHRETEVSATVAARILRVSLGKVRELAKAGKIKTTRTDPVGEQIIDYDSVIDYILELRKENAT